jgi:hypothetical protein
MITKSLILLGLWLVVYCVARDWNKESLYDSETFDS